MPGVGVDVNAQNSFGETPVHQAVFNQSLKTVMLDLLRKEGANLNIPSNKGETPLHYAVRVGREGMLHSCTMPIRGTNIVTLQMS